MAELIDRQAVLDLIQDNWYASNEFYLNHIKEIPAVDAVSVIRCEDCKYGHVRALTKDGTVKGMWCDDSAMYTLKQWCSRAERKEE